MVKRKNIITRAIFNPKFLSLIGLAIIVLISFPIARNISQRHRVNNEINELQEEIKSIESKNSDLQKLIDYLSSDQYAEEQARLNFGLKKQGEETAVIDINGDDTSQIGSQSGENAVLPEEDAENKITKSIFNIQGLDKIQPKKPVSNPQRWRNYFLNGNINSNK
jgi:cell division protein FtsB